MWKPNSFERESMGPPARIPWRQVVLWLLLVALACLLLKALRGGKARGLATLSVPILTLTALEAGPQGASGTESKGLAVGLKEIASEFPLLTPTELFAVLKENGLRFPSIQVMGRELRSLGLQSEICSVPGRSERRWYDLSKLSGQELLHG